MEKTLTREVKFGKATAVVEVKFYNPIIHTDWDEKIESTKVEKFVSVKIVAPNGKVVENDGYPSLVEDNDYWHDTMIKAGMDLNKKYTKVNNCITEGDEAYKAIKGAISEMEAELAKEFEVKTEKEEEIEEAKAIIEAAEKEGIENLMTADQIKTWRKSYNNVMNEGGEGYIPTKVSKEQYQKALEVLGR